MLSLVVTMLSARVPEHRKMSAKYATSLVFVVTICVLVQLRASPLTQLLTPLLNAVSPAQADELRRPERDRWQMPDEVLAALDLKKGDVVADIGAGAGYFTMHFAQAVGPGGKVYAVDIAAHVLEYLKKEARKRNLNNIETIVSREDDPLLPRASVDLAFFCDTVHEIAGRVDFYRKVKQALKRNGRMVVIDSMPPPARQGPVAPESERQVSRDSAVREAEQAGFRLLKEPKFLPQQFFLVFKRLEHGADTKRR